jgi:hypothetical protein
MVVCRSAKLAAEVTTHLVVCATIWLRFDEHSMPEFMCCSTSLLCVTQRKEPYEPLLPVRICLPLTLLVTAPTAETINSYLAAQLRTPDKQLQLFMTSAAEVKAMLGAVKNTSST